MKKFIFSLIFAPAILLMGCNPDKPKEDDVPGGDLTFAFKPLEINWGVPSDFVMNYSTTVTSYVADKDVTLEDGTIEMMFSGNIEYDTDDPKWGTTVQSYYYFSPEDQLIKAVAFMHINHYEKMFERAQMNGQYDAVNGYFTQLSTNSIIRVVKGPDPRTGKQGTLAIFEPIQSPVGIELNFVEPIQEWGLMPGVLQERIDELGGNGANLVPAGGNYFSYPGEGSADNFGYLFADTGAGARLYRSMSIFKVLYTTEVKKHLDALYEYTGSASSASGNVDIFFNPDKMASIYVWVDDSLAGKEPPLLMVEFRQVEYTK